MKLLSALAIFAGLIVYFSLHNPMEAIPVSPASPAATAAAQAGGDVEAGKEVFEQCGVCHAVDSDEKKMGPSLKGLFKKDKMQNGKKPTEENVRAVIKTGGNGMPEYAEILSDEEMNHLIAYLKTV